MNVYSFSWFGSSDSDKKENVDNPTFAALMNNYNVYSNNDLIERIKFGFKFRDIDNNRVRYWEKRYGHQRQMDTIFNNSQYYLYYIITRLNQAGLPTEIAFIPIVESTYNAEAISPSGISTGIWQFINPTAKQYGLIKNESIDERKDISKSTIAAINYLQYLYSIFGSWELAIYAYNIGEGTLYKQIAKQGTTNIDDLQLRDTTKDYYAKIIALRHIIENPGKFGIKLPKIQNEAKVGLINNNLNYSDFLIKYKITPGEFKKLNPQFKSNDRIMNISGQRLFMFADRIPAQEQDQIEIIAMNNANNIVDDESTTMSALVMESTENIIKNNESKSALPVEYQQAESALDSLLDNLQTGLPGESHNESN